MKKTGLLSLGVGTLLFAQASTPAEPTIRYKTYNLPSSIIRTLTIPARSRFVVTLAVSPQLDTLENFAKEHRAIAVLNAGFFDPVNRKTTSYVTLQGKLVADPRQNERLVKNPELVPYLDRILNRTEFRRYLCEDWRYDIALHDEAVPQDCTLVDAVGAGPRLLPELTSQLEAFVTNERQGIRDALGSRQPNARTAIGITGDGSVVWVMAAQKPTAAGMSLAALAEFMKSLGVKEAMNLDGGSSSALYFQGKTFIGKLSRSGQDRRPVKSVLLIKATPRN